MAKKKKKSWQPSKSAAESAKLRLPSLASQFFQTGRKAAGNRVPLQELHSFRLKTKRFRYTLELFRPCYGEGLDRKLGELRQIQRFLGDLSDCLTTRELMRQTGVRGSKQSAELGWFLDSRAAAKAEEFHRYWIDTFDQPGRERSWTNYLIRFAGRRGKSRPK
jgi:CHAD domain-containing protein